MPDSPVTIITGAGSGIGRATAAQLAVLKHRLVLTGRRRDALAQTAEMIAKRSPNAPAAFTFPADLSTEDGPAAITQAARKHFGRVDNLINNAGLAQLKPLEQTTLRYLQTAFEVNTFGPIRLIATLWDDLRASSGCVINVTSMSTVDPFPGLSVYAAAKSAMESITRSIMNEAGETGVRAFSVAPGAVETDMLRGLFSKDQLPADQTLTPEAVASVIVACLTGEREADIGRTVLVRND